MTKDDIIDFLQTNKKKFLEKYQISHMTLFGSYARGENHEDSDIDIAIETPVSDYFLLYDFKEELEQALHHKVDIVRLREKMNEALKRRIVQEGIYV